MSHYARLVSPLKVYGRAQLAPVELPIGTAIKGVLVFDEGYTFAARIGRLWVMCQTAEDLPAFTDKGREHREAHRANSTLRRGRPRVSSTAATKRLVCKVTDEQHDYVERCAAQLDITVSEHVRRALISDGMPE